MKFYILLILMSLQFILPACAQNFKNEQQRYPRVREAYKEKEQKLLSDLAEIGLQTFPKKIVLIAYKDERDLQLWGQFADSLKLIQTYKFCASSGTLGPKIKSGDGQIPEGIYHIQHFNPASNFHLSLGVNYPNTIDRARSGSNNPGGDIYIHGACVTIGCIPITDDKIAELYIYAIEARNSGQNHIPVYMFPYRMTNEKFNLEMNRTDDAETQKLWNQLKPIEQKFRESPAILKILQNGGAYQLM